MIEIIIANIVFWSVYTWVCTIPYRMFQSAIDNS
jgi:hypothetical protein